MTKKETNELELAKSAWLELRDQRRELEDRLQGAKAAHDLVPIRDWSGCPPVVVARAETYLAGRTLGQDRILAEIQSLEHQLTDLQPRLQGAKVRLDAAQAAERIRRAAELAPKHEEAVRRVVTCARALAAACAAESRIRLEAGHPGTMWPASTEFGDVGDPTSALGRWHARAVVAGAVGHER